MTLEEAKTYLRIDGEAEDDLITALLASAESYLRGAVTDYDAKRADPDCANVADMVQRLMIAEMYENRSVGTDAQKDYSFAVRSMITQLQNWEEP